MRRPLQGRSRLRMTRISPMSVVSSDGQTVPGYRDALRPVRFTRKLKRLQEGLPVFSKQAPAPPAGATITRPARLPRALRHISAALPAGWEARTCSWGRPIRLAPCPAPDHSLAALLDMISERDSVLLRIFIGTWTQA